MAFDIPTAYIGVLVGDCIPPGNKALLDRCGNPASLLLGVDGRVRCAFFDKVTGLPVDPAGVVDYFTLEITRHDGAFIREVADNVDFGLVTDAATWEEGDEYHAQFSIDKLELAPEFFLPIQRVPGEIIPESTTARFVLYSALLTGETVPIGYGELRLQHFETMVITAQQKTSTAIPGGAQSVDVTIPSGFEFTDIIGSPAVVRIDPNAEEVGVSDTVDAGGIVRVYLSGSPEFNTTHQVNITFAK